MSARCFVRDVGICRRFEANWLWWGVNRDRCVLPARFANAKASRPRSIGCDAAKFADATARTLETARHTLSLADCIEQPGLVNFRDGGDLTGTRARTYPRTNFRIDGVCVYITTCAWYTSKPIAHKLETESTRKSVYTRDFASYETSGSFISCIKICLYVKMCVKCCNVSFDVATIKLLLLNLKQIIEQDEERDIEGLYLLRVKMKSGKRSMGRDSSF